MKLIGTYAIFIWAGILPVVLGNWGLDTWQAWLTIISIVFLTHIHYYTRSS